MDRIAVNENSPVGSGGACMFTGSAAYANIVFNLRDQQIALIGYHMARLGRTVFRASPACSLLCFDNAIVLYENCLAYLCQFFGIKHKGHDGPGGAYIGTPCALVVAEATVKIHPGLHDAGESILIHGRLEDICGAGIHAEGACRAS